MTVIKNMILVAVFSVIGFTAHADSVDLSAQFQIQEPLDFQALQRHHHRKPFCKEAKITREQMLDMKVIHATYQRDTYSMKKEMHKAMHNYHMVVADPASTEGDAIKALLPLGKAHHKLTTTMVKMKHEILFDVAEPDQRAPLMKCMHKKKMRKKIRKCKKLIARTTKPPVSEEEPPPVTMPADPAPVEEAPAVEAPEDNGAEAVVNP